jgi:protoporphyrinogen oxidase
VARLAVIGAGSMGLAAAYHAQQLGHEVTVYEGDDRPGGMAAHFDFGGLSLERFYHFVCKADAPLFELLDELGLGDKMRWRPTSMAYYYHGELHKWGDPVSLLRFPHLSLAAKIRYGAHAFYSTKRSDWTKLDRLPADRWVRAWIGAEAYDKLWRSLFELKFFEYSNNISAAWIWTRLKRIGTSRRSIFQEELGYIEGGSETLIGALSDRVREAGGKILLSTPVEEVVVEQGRIAGIRAGGATQAFDAVISTVPIPIVGRMIPALPEDLRARYEALPNIGVVCVVRKLSRAVTPHFWVNIVDDRMDIPGIIEFSNLRPLGSEHIVYVPYYMPQTHPKFGRDDAFFEEETRRYLKLINPQLTDADFLDVKIGRLRFAQPVCPPGFLDMLPPVQTPIHGLQIADTSYYYPEDRGISESVRLARRMAAAV